MLIVESIVVVAGLVIGGLLLIVRSSRSPSPPPTTSASPLSELQLTPSPTEEVIRTGASYKIASGQTGGWFQTGQTADLMLSGIGFNQTGGSLLFNHPGGIATDGQRLLLADRMNNRVLIWNTLPAGNVPPDLVLGQANFDTNTPGEGLNQLNWPVAVAAAGGRVIVADTYNDRLLIWNSFPTINGQPADLAITNGGPSQGNQREALGSNSAKHSIGWPWAIWTDGTKLVMTSTAGARVLIWNSLPVQNDQPADLILDAGGDFGTPRSIGSDGQHLIIGDHNAKPVNGQPGNFFWKTFPTKDTQPYDFFMAGPTRQDTPSPPTQGGNQPVQLSQPHGEILWNPVFTRDGKVITMSSALTIWNQFPEDANDPPDLVVGGDAGPGDQGPGVSWAAGDGTGLALANERFYIALYNGNKIVGFKNIPTNANQQPDFVIGAPDLNTNTLDTNYFITNGVPATDGRHLIVSSDFDRKVYLWKAIPDESGAHPDLILPYAGWDNELHAGRFVLAGRETIYIWEDLPLDGEPPDRTFQGAIGSVRFKNVRGVALDDRYFYLADKDANTIYVWEGLPSPGSDPTFTLETNQPQRLSSDGTYLVVTATEDNENGHVRIYKIADLSASAKPVVLDRRTVPTNLPQHAIAQDGHLFIGDTGFNRVLVWKDIEQAFAGQAPDTILGAKDLTETKPEIGPDKLFWPAGLTWDGNYLWVGEFKFGNRLLRFSPHPES